MYCIINKLRSSDTFDLYSFPSGIGFEELPRITLLHRRHILRSPAFTISPLASPGPISMREAVDVITFGLCPVTTAVSPFLTGCLGYYKY